MKKLLTILFVLPLIFGSCEKEEEDNNNNNNSSLSLEQTKWTVSSIKSITSWNGTEIFNLPVTDEEGWDVGLEEIEWTFFNNNGIFVEKYTNGYNNTFYDTLQYTYYENLNTILFNNNGWNINSGDPNGEIVSFLGGNFSPVGNGIQIIEFNSNTLNVEMNDEDEFYTLYLEIENN